MSTQLEDLPNELFYIIFTHLNSIDLYLAFCKLNERFRQLLDDVACHQSLDLTSGHISYERFRAYIADRYNVRSSFISSLKVDCFNLSPFDIKDLFSCFANTSIPNRLQRLILITNEAGSVTAIDIIKLLERMMIANKQGHGRLEHLILKFEYFDNYYAMFRNNMIQKNISFDTMILNVTNYILPVRLRFQTPASYDATNLHTAIDTRPLLKNTVRLSLSLEICNDLVLLLQHDVLPFLQHLNVIFKRRYVYINPYRVRFKVAESDLLTTDTSRLRSLSLRNLRIQYALQFVRFLHLTQLDTLRLINVFDKTLSDISDLERAISIRLYNLVTLQFVLRFPMHKNSSNNELYSLQDYAMLQSDLWKSRGWFVHDYIDIEEKEYIIYTIPYSLSSDYQLRNHTFMAAQQPSFVQLKTYECLQWTCTDANPSFIIQSVNGLSRARHLYWNWAVGISRWILTSSDTINSVTQWPSMQLCSLYLVISWEIPLEDRAKLITQILLICPRLRTLSVRSDELAQCLEKKPPLILSSLDQLHLMISQDQKMIDPFHLAAVFPNISSLSTAEQCLTIDIKLGHIVLSLIELLPHLRRIRFNQHPFYYSYGTDQSIQSDHDSVVQMIKNSEQRRLTNSFIKVYRNSYLFIWL